MSMRAIAHFEITSWEQTPYDEPEKGAALAQAEVKKRMTGEMEGSSNARLLMCGSPDGSAGYVASERFTGYVAGHAGSFVLQHGGGMANGQPVDAFGYVVPGSGTDELQGLRGHCRFYHDEHEATLTLEYDL